MSKSENKKTSKDEDKKKSEAKAIGDAIIAAANARREELAKESLATRSNKTLPRVVKEKPKKKPKEEKPKESKPKEEKPKESKPKEEKPKESKPKEEKPKESKPKEEKPKAAPPSKTDTEEESLPEFEKSFVDKISSQFAGDVEVGYIKENRTRVNVKKEKILEVAQFIKDNLPFDHAESVTGVDFPEDKEIGVVYHLGSYTDPTYSKQVLALATRVPREENPNPGNDSTRLPSLRDMFYSVEFHEREIFEMLGVYFESHPDNRRLLLPEDWADLPPLRKDFRNKGR